MQSRESMIHVHPATNRHICGFKKIMAARGKIAVVFLAVKEFNHIFHMIGEILKGGQREGNVSRTKA